MTVTVLIVDDHPVVREGLRAVLTTDQNIAVLTDVATGEEAIETAVRLAPDVVLMDLRLPGIDGIGAIKQIVEAGTSAVLVLTTYGTDTDIARAVAAGASGYLLKDTPGRDLLAAVHATARGETVLAGPVAAKLADQVREQARTGRLSERETEVLHGIARGLSNPDIAGELFITEATVKSHVTRIFAKLSVNDRTAAVTTAIARGILPPPQAEPPRVRGHAHKA
jgi:DNA-binding NarL/FixJ family response regulator